MNMDYIKLDGKEYNFFDSLQKAQAKNSTIREIVLTHESAIEDPRVEKLFGKEMTVAVAEARRQKLFADQMSVI